MYRVRRDGAPGYEPTPEQRAAYQREHSPERKNDLPVKSEQTGDKAIFTVPEVRVYEVARVPFH